MGGQRKKNDRKMAKKALLSLFRGRGGYGKKTKK